jgi:hypothetical protein
MRIVEYVLIESKVEYVTRTLGDKILDKLMTKDNSYTGKALASKEPSAEQLVAKMAEADPTPNRKFLQWIANAYIKGSETWEDLGRMRNALSAFMTKQREMPNPDILSYTTLPDLEKTIASVEKDAADEKNLPYNFKHEEAELVETLPKGNIYQIMSVKAARHYGTETVWCTNAREPCESYLSRGKLYIFMAKNGRKIQMHFESKQVMDEQNDPVSLKELLSLGGSELVFWISDRSPKHAYQFAKGLVHKGKEVPERFLSVIAKDSEYSSWFAKYLVSKGKEVPEMILSAIAKDSEHSYYFAKYLIENYKEVPERFLSVIAKDSEHSYYFAKDLVHKGKEVPERFLSVIAKDSKYSYRFSSYLVHKGKEVPEMIMSAIAKDSKHSYLFARYLVHNGKEVPERFLSAIAKDSVYSSEFASYLASKDKEVPEIIKAAI